MHCNDRPGRTLPQAAVPDPPPVRGPPGPLPRRHGGRGGREALRIQPRVLPQPVHEAAREPGPVPLLRRAQAGSEAEPRRASQAAAGPAHPGASQDRRPLGRRDQPEARGGGDARRNDDRAAHAPQERRRQAAAPVPRRARGRAPARLRPDGRRPGARPLAAAPAHRVRRAVPVRPRPCPARPRPDRRRQRHAGQRDDPRGPCLPGPAGAEALGDREAAARHGPTSSIPAWPCSPG